MKVQEEQSGPDEEPSSGRSSMHHVSASQVGYGGVESLTEAPSEPQVNRGDAAVPEVAASQDEQSAVRDSSKSVSGQS